jgi:hypothetical protein
MGGIIVSNVYLTSSLIQLASQQVHYETDDDCTNKIFCRHDTQRPHGQHCHPFGIDQCHLDASVGCRGGLDATPKNVGHVERSCVDTDSSRASGNCFIYMVGHGIRASSGWCLVSSTVG